MHIINTGTTANDGTGDDLRTSFTKINENFVEVVENVDEKASLLYVDSVIINTYVGTAKPYAALGKDGDYYKRFPSDTPVTVMNELSSGNYDAENLFEVFYAAGSFDLWQVKIGYKLGIILLKYGSNGTPDEYGYTMQIDGGTVYDLMLYGSNSQAVTLKFPVEANADVASITTATNIKIASKQLSGEVLDYVKYASVWFENVIPFARATAITDFAATMPTKAELVTAFNSAENHDFAHQHDLYVKNNQGEYLIHYHPNGDTSEAGVNYKFYWEKLEEAV